VPTIYPEIGDMHYMADNAPINNTGVLDAAPKRVSAQRVKQRMRGITQADLVETDGDLYIVKWKQNPVHRRVLVNSLIGAEVLRRLDVAVPDCAFVVADEDFCRRHRSDHPHLQPGMHFGLRRPGNPITTAVYDLIPRVLSRRVVNSADFVRALVFDCWVDNAKPRQAVYTGSGEGYFGRMIGNGHILGFRSGAWSSDSPPAVRLPLPLATFVYREGAAASYIEDTILHIQKSAHSSLEAIQQIIPEEWLESDRDEMTRVLENLLRRTTALPSIIQASLAELS
jgi:hypothetical protein